jgi:hypothetical protein
MNKLIAFKSMGTVALLGMAAIFNASPAMADTVIYTGSLQSGNTCTGCGPFGTVTVSSVTGHSNELSVTLDLTSGEVFAIGGAGSALLFDISGNPALSASSLTTGFSFNQASKHADGSGTWNTYISCNVCGSGTSPPTNSGPVSFILSVASGTLTPSSFVTNGSGYLFASDIGVPNGSGGYYTGDVVTTGPLTPVPLPASVWLMLSGLVGVGAMARKRRTA